jgi:aminoglycoside 3-N-acetyltransferase
MTNRDLPVGVDDLARDLRALGVVRGDVILVHASLRRIGGPTSMVAGGAVAVIEAIERAIGSEGTLAMPAFSADYSEPALWVAPPVPEDWWPILRERGPAWQPDRAPTFRIGVVPEAFRRMDGVRRSFHPQASFCASGAHAAHVTAAQPLDEPFGEAGPLGKLARLDAKILMLGTGWDTCTSLHLAEMRMTRRGRPIRQGAPVMKEGLRTWIEWTEPEADSTDFGACGEAWERSAPPPPIRRGLVGRARTLLVPMCDAVAFATGWLETARAAARPTSDR